MAPTFGRLCVDISSRDARPNVGAAQPCEVNPGSRSYARQSVEEPSGRPSVDSSYLLTYEMSLAAKLGMPVCLLRFCRTDNRPWGAW